MRPTSTRPSALAATLRPAAALLAALLIAGPPAARAAGPEPAGADGERVLVAAEGSEASQPAEAVTPAASDEAEAAATSPEARYAAARDSAVDGAVDTARALLDGLSRDAEAPVLVRRNSLHLLGRLALAAGDPAAAVDAYTKALELGRTREAKTALDDVLRWGLAQALAATGHRAEAFAELRRVEAAPLSPYREQALRLQARLTEEAGDAKQARRLYDRFLDRYPDSPVAREVMVRRAALDIARDDVKRALGPLRALVREAPESRAGLEALLLLEKAGAAAGAGPVDLEQVEYLMSERRFDEARALLGRAIDEAQVAGQRNVEVRAMELLLRTQFESFRFTEALAAHRWLAERRGDGLDDWRLTRVHAYLGDFDAAEKVYLDRYGKRKGRAYWDAVGELRYEFGRYRDAYRAYYQARKAGRRGDPDPTERMVWCMLRMGDAEQAGKAARWFGDRGGRGRGTGKLYERYWYGRALQLSGDEASARAVFEGLGADAPWEYYGVQAWSRIAELDGTAPARWGAARPHGTVAWSEGSLAGAFAEAPRRAPPAVIEAAIRRLAEAHGEAAPEAVRALELASLGLLDDAAAELRVIGMDLRTLSYGGTLSNRARADMLDNRATKRARSGAKIHERGRKTASAARAFTRNARAIRSELRDAQRTLAEPYALRRGAYEDGGFDDGPKSSAWRDSYPIAYPQLVQPFARQFGVPPYFAYAVMTVESAFHPHAISVSDAYGLLQMIPRTGRRVAAELGYSEFSPELLLEPSVNVYFGTYYLGSALNKFQGQEPLAAAAYNAGPHRVAAWLLARGEGPMDMFIEEIPFGQARGYAKSVLKHLARYRAIYHGELHTYVANTIARDFSAEPNY